MSAAEAGQDLHARIEELRRLVEDARSMPMSASAVVNRTEVLALLDGLRAAADTAFAEASHVVAAREDVVGEARARAELIVADAHNERDRLVSDTEVYRLAQRRAEELLASAREEAEGLRTETDAYVDTKLANFEIALEKTMEAVRRGRDKLAGRTELDSLTAEEADKIRLPDHLEG